MIKILALNNKYPLFDVVQALAGIAEAWESLSLEVIPYKDKPIRLKYVCRGFV